MKKRKFILTKNDDGTWKCQSSILPKSFVVANTPNEAVERMEITLDRFGKFNDHHDGKCDKQNCEWCK